MKQEIERTQIKQATKKEDTNVRHLGTEIKQELDNETEYNVQSQLPLLAGKIKQEQICTKSEESISIEDFNIIDSKIERHGEIIVKEEKVQKPDVYGEDNGWNVREHVCCCTQTCYICSSVGISQYDKDSFYIDQSLEPASNGAYSERLTEHIRGSEDETGDLSSEVKVWPDTGSLCWGPNEVRESGKALDSHMMTAAFKMTQNDESLTLRNGDDRKLSEGELDVCEKSDQHAITDANLGMYISLQSHNRDEVVGKHYRCDSSREKCHLRSLLDAQKQVPTEHRPNRCDVCGKGFTKFFNITRHKRIHTREQPYKCVVCGAGFSESSSLSRHKRIHTGEKPYKCVVCGIGFSESSSLSRHKRTHTGEKPYQCDICAVGFSENGHLTRHKRTHTGERPYKCEECGFGFSSSGLLKTHERTHTGEKPYKCNVCGTGFSRSGHLKTHYIIHTGEKPYRCKVCGTGFSRSGNLKTHNKIHTGEKPYKCAVCGVGFSESGVLTRHTRIHTGEKPFRCDVCGVGFSRSEGMKTHKRQHTGEKPFKCDVCCKSFSDSGSLKTHKRRHTGEKPFKCDVCGTKFTHRATLKAHERTHNRIEALQV